MGRRGRQIAILDRNAVSDLIMLAVRASKRGSVNAAARKIGLNQSILSRLADRKRERITPATYKKLQQLMSPAHHPSLDRALLLPDSRAVLRNYARWLRREIGENESLVAALRLNELERERAVADVVERHGWRINFARMVRSRYPDLVKRLAAGLKKYHHTPARARLAWKRVIQPLIDAEGSFGIERQWPELAASRELRSVLSHGIARELILLKRLPDEDRAQRVKGPRGSELSRLVQSWRMWDTPPRGRHRDRRDAGTPKTATAPAAKDGEKHAV